MATIVPPTIKFSEFPAQTVALTDIFVGLQSGANTQFTYVSAPNDATYLIQTADADLPNAQVMGALASGFVVNTTTTGVQLSRVLQGTSSEIEVTNGDGISSDPVIGISDNPVMPGTAGMGLPAGTTGQRVTPTTPNINMRWNTTINAIEYFDHGSLMWEQLAESLPDGPDNSVQFNNAGAFGGSANFTWDGTQVAVTGDLQVDNINIDGNTISSTDTDGNINFAPNGTGSVIVGTGSTLFQINSSTAIDGVIDDDTMATASDTNVATAASIVAYIAATPGGAGGSDTQVQYNNAGTLDGDSGFTTDGSGNLVSTGTFKLQADSAPLSFGAGDDATIQYDGTNLVINPQAAGSGDTIFNNGKVGIAESSPQSLLSIGNSSEEDFFQSFKSKNVLVATSMPENTSYQRLNVNIGSANVSAILTLSWTSSNPGGVSRQYGGKAEFAIFSSNGGNASVRPLVIYNAQSTLGSISIDTPTTSSSDVIFGFTAANNGTSATYTLNIDIGIISSSPDAITATEIGGTTASGGTALAGKTACFDRDGNIATVISTNGNFGIGTTTPSALLDVAGVINTNDDITITADSKALTLGAGGDATIQYDGTDLLIDPQAVGSGNLVQSNGNFHTAGISFNSGTDVLDAFNKAGTFTPTFDFATTGDLSVVYSVQLGYFQRVGNGYQVTVLLACTPTFTTASGNARIGIALTSDMYAVGSFSRLDGAGVSLPANLILLEPVINSGDAFIVPNYLNTSGTAAQLTAGDFVSGSACVMYLSIFTRTA